MDNYAFKILSQKKIQYLAKIKKKKSMNKIK